MVKRSEQPWPGSSVGYSVIPIQQGAAFDSWSGNTQGKKVPSVKKSGHLTKEDIQMAN